MQHAYDKKIIHIKNKELEKKLSDDIYILQASQSRRVFDLSYKLLCLKYHSDIKKSDEIKLFFEYFHTTWINFSTNQWLEGAGIHDPSFNNIIKSHQTLLENGFLCLIFKIKFKKC